MMEHIIYEVEKCPLSPINGFYYANQDGYFVHENGKFVLATSEGYWQIWILPCVPQGKPHCVTMAPSDSPLAQSWMYYSTRDGRNGYVESSRMFVKTFTETADASPKHELGEEGANTTHSGEIDLAQPPQELLSHTSTIQQKAADNASSEPPQQGEGVAVRDTTDQTQSSQAEEAPQPETQDEQAPASQEGGELCDTESEGGSSASPEKEVHGSAEDNSELSQPDAATEAPQATSTSATARPSISRGNSATVQTTAPVDDAASAASAASEFQEDADSTSADTTSAALPDPVQVPEDSAMDVCPPNQEENSGTDADVSPDDTDVTDATSTTATAAVEQHEPTEPDPPQEVEPPVLPPPEPPVRPEMTRTTSGSARPEMTRTASGSARPEMTRTASGSYRTAASAHTDKEKEKEKARAGNQHYGRQLLPLSPVSSVEQLPPYTKPVPHMKPGDLASNWKAEEEYTWTGSRTIKYTNRVTQEVRADKPMALQYQPTVCSFNLKTINRHQVEMFAPAKCIQDLGGHPVKASYDASWEKVAPYWSSTVAAYEHELGNLHAYIKSLQARQDCIAHREVETNTIIASLEKKLEETQESEKVAQHRADNMMARSGKSYIKRDWQQTNLESTFPAGDDIRAEFTSALINFETFACDAVNCLEDAGHDKDAGELFVQVMKSIHEVTLNYVRDLLHNKQELLLSTFGVAVDFEDFNPEVDSVGKLFWYSTQQVQILAAISQLTDADIHGLLEQMNPLVARLHALMLAAAATQIIDDSEDSLRIPKLVHFMLRVHAVALLSDPRCYLEPIPGERIQYKAHEHGEVLSPGAMRYGRIKENDEVEVVLCGLYFDHPSKAGTKPVIPTLVRRLLK